MLAPDFYLETAIKAGQAVISFFCTPEGKALLIAYGFIRGINYYLWRSSILEAHDSAAALLVLVLFLIFIVARHEVIKAMDDERVQCSQDRVKKLGAVDRLGLARQK